MLLVLLAAVAGAERGARAVQALGLIERYGGATIVGWVGSVACAYACIYVDRRRRSSVLLIDGALWCGPNRHRLSLHEHAQYTASSRRWGSLSQATSSSPGPW